MKRRNFFGSLLGASALGVVASKVEAEPEKLAYNPKTTSFKTKGVELSSSQLKVAQYFNDDHTREIGYFGGKGVGKTFLHCHLLYNYAMQHGGASLMFGRKKMVDVLKFFVLPMKEYIQDYGDKEAVVFNASTNSFDFFNGSVIHLVHFDNFHGYYSRVLLDSLEFNVGIVDHASEVEQTDINLVRSRLRRGPMKLIVSSIPPQRTDPTHWLYDRYYMPGVARMLPKWMAFIQGSIEENKHLSKQYAQSLKSLLDERQYKRIVQGNWNIS